MSIEIDGFTSSKLKNNNFEKSLYLTKLPTKEWLINQKIIFKDDHIYVLISELFKRNTIIVKLNYKNDNFMEYYISKKLLHHRIPNVIKFYGTIKCYESNENYKLMEKNKTELFENGYCNGDNNEKLINLTVIKKYEDNQLLSNNKLNLMECLECIYQIIITQLILYKDYGILHNDLLNAGNMFVVPNDKVIKYEYNVKNIKNIYIKASKKIILFDFDKANIIDPIFRLKYINNTELELKECNIINNIVKSIKIIFNQLDDQSIINKVNFIEDLMLSLDKICLVHIHTINRSLYHKDNSKLAQEISMKLAEDFTIKVLRGLFSYDNQMNTKIIEFNKYDEKLDIFSLTGIVYKNNL